MGIRDDKLRNRDVVNDALYNRCCGTGAGGLGHVLVPVDDRSGDCAEEIARTDGSRIQGKSREPGRRIGLPARTHSAAQQSLLNGFTGKKRFWQLKLLAALPPHRVMASAKPPAAGGIS